MSMKVQFREDAEGNKFPFVDVGSETHGRISFRLWVSARFITQNEKYILQLPVRGARIVKTEKGSFVLRPADGIVHNIFVPAGYRGESEYEILEPAGCEEFPYRQFESELGSLGVSRGALVNAPADQPLKYRWVRSGRLYGAPAKGMTIVMPDGSEKPFEELPDGLEAMRELAREVRA